MKPLVDPELAAAVEASRRDMYRQQNRHPASQASNFVDLTNDSGNDSDIEEVFPKSKSVVSSETEDDHEHEQLQRALAMSMEPNDRTKTPEHAPPIKHASAPHGDSVVSAGSLLGMNRKQMEEERLARLAKRKADDSSSTPPSQTSRKLPRTEPLPVQHPVALRNPFQSAPQVSTARVRSRTEVCRQLASNSPNINIQPTSRSVAQWPLGAVKKTHITGFPRSGNEITIEEVIQRDDLELGVFSSFLWDMPWLYSKFNNSTTRILFVMQANDEETREQYRQDVSNMPNFRLCFPPMEPQVFCMHSKLLLMFHPGYLRIAVPSANLTPTDWGEDRLMENTVFLIDLPKLDVPEAGKTPFYEELVYFLQASELHRNIIKKLDEFDFSETKRYAFVHTIGGTNTEGKWQRTGSSGLGRAVKALGLETNAPINVDYIASSLGNINTPFLRSIYLACKGDNALLDYELRTANKKKEPRTEVEAYNQECLDHFRVYFPSDETAQDVHSNAKHAIGTICFNPAWWSGANFPRDTLRDCVSERGVLMHNKLAFVHPSTPIEMPDNKECRGWAYVGSANLSESAWGRIVKDPKTKQLKMNCRNWECGVIVPIINEKKTEKKDKGPETNGPVPSAPLPVEVFRDTVPVPMRVPAVPLSESRRPFFFGV
ncbi:Tyrosyl-DNA phosphodiesterase [Penicillium expansum]|uniref:Tyrosyl-DNA phosphodiesterase n=1 Tax=Penicillium expansum TaxID=27334 RepID=A0A0A2JXA6_PENEN|nr:Tyrosyl-DNA phosphodiesterase [Penicillium expansum]KGO49227.1 Tyrosyl-DNA phosphodiesterase [Penicillium expansum]KGO54158.1 Tyrosyl-DNA phosphodiesterase [Penicillium expansum]KGO56825.1 Tyrosyl-DNA phosphodiesterase [Penicillium expansum]